MPERPLNTVHRLAALAQSAETQPLEEWINEGACQRRETRKKQHRIALIQIADGEDLPCVITDMSANGARIRLKAIAVLPAFVVLKEPLGGASRRARVAWQRDSSAGLSFRIDQRANFAVGRNR
ncbi:MAG: PilZ domain-containing protein [Parvularculaceae bacterium]